MYNIQSKISRHMFYWALGCITQYRWLIMSSYIQPTHNFLYRQEGPYSKLSFFPVNRKTSSVEISKTCMCVHEKHSTWMWLPLWMYQSLNANYYLRTIISYLDRVFDYFEKFRLRSRYDNLYWVFHLFPYLHQWTSKIQYWGMTWWWSSPDTLSNIE